MKTEEIAALPVSQIVPANAHLYLWITNNFLARGAHVQVANGWGFRPVTVLTWKKLGRIGLGQYFRGTTEHVVFCVRGAPPYAKLPSGLRAQGITDFTIEPFLEFEDIGPWWEEPRPGVHSRKPMKIHEWAEIVSPGPYLEMFARTARPGWEAWGNEAPEASYDVLG